MPAISKIRLTNVVYEEGAKRYNDETFVFDGHNGALILENGGGKTVFVQTVLQAVLPHADLAGRKAIETYALAGQAMHIAIEWILSDVPRRYALTAVTLFLSEKGLQSLRYVYEYEEGDAERIEKLPFALQGANGRLRPADKHEMHDYYTRMQNKHLNAQLFTTNAGFHQHLEEQYKIIPSEWRKIATINSAEGDVEKFFDACNTTVQLVDQLLIPTVEEGMAGRGVSGFADVFEGQREKFKVSKQLRDRLEESKRVSEQIRAYTAVFSSYHEATQALLQEKQTAKALHQQARHTADQLGEQLTNAQQEKRLAERELQRLQATEAAREIAVEECKGVELRQRLAEAQAHLGQRESRWEEQKHRYDSLEYAKHQQQFTSADQQYHYTEQRLSKLGQDEAVADLLDQYERNKRQIRGWYVEAERKIEQEQTLVRAQLARWQEERNNLQDQSKAMENQIQNMHVEIEKRNVTIETAQKQMERIASTILNNPLQERVEDMYPTWLQLAEECQQNQVQYREVIGESKRRKEATIARLQLATDQLAQEQAHVQKWTALCGQAEQKAQKLLHELHALHPAWRLGDSLYHNQPRILQLLEERAQSLQHAKERLLQEERKSTRLSDEFGEVDVFMADPELNRFVQRVKDQFHYLELGTSYLNDICAESEQQAAELYERFPYWSITLVTTEHEVSPLAKRLEALAPTLRFPCLLLTTTEIRDVIAGTRTLEGEGQRILPTMWRDNVQVRAFAKWKERLLEQAKSAEQERIAQEAIIKIHHDLQAKVGGFYAEYPRESYLEWQARAKSSHEAVQELEQVVADSRKEMQHWDVQWQLYQTKWNDEMLREQALGQKIQAALDYQEQKSVQERAVRERDMSEGQRKQQLGELKNLHKRLASAVGVLEELKEQENERKLERDALMHQELYGQVRQVDPLATPTPLDVLRMEHADLKDRLNQHQRTRRDLEEQLERSRGQRDNHENEMQRIQRRSTVPLDLTLSFPLNGDAELDRLTESIRALGGEVAELHRAMQELERRVTGQEAVVQTKIKAFEKDHPGTVRASFAQDLELVRVELLERAEQLRSRLIWIGDQADNLEKQHHAFVQAYDLLEKKHERYQFLQEEIQGVPMAEAERLKFFYQPYEWVEARLQVLAQQDQALQREKEKVERAKVRFKEFCQHDILDVRLREKAVSGIENRHSFEEISNWAQRMEERIQQGITLLEDSLRDHNKELEQFLAQIHAHLRKLVEELACIPKKTRVKIEDHWKEIYVFTIPEWEESAGKQAIRDHLDWMIEQLDSEKFRDEDGREDLGKVKKWIANKLQSKQLLRIVFGEKSIQVKCRKVSNDRKVSSGLTSWESSNKWSGGEKWSKNMALFLGILNYLAEKKQSIPPSGKRHRTVIMDNPFGKASSGHVLDPVFFIADQLGFQMIALTAHAEGKFLRDYFPIVHSCRLRESVSGRTSILTPEKEINRAYFRNHDPQALTRLTQNVQVSLFAP